MTKLLVPQRPCNGDRVDVFLCIRLYENSTIKLWKPVDIQVPFAFILRFKWLKASFRGTNPSNITKIIFPKEKTKKGDSNSNIYFLIY